MYKMVVRIKRCLSVKGSRLRISLICCISIVIILTVILNNRTNPELQKEKNRALVKAFYLKERSSDDKIKQWPRVTNWTHYVSNKTLEFSTLNRARNNPLLEDFNCSAMFAGDKDETESAQAYVRDVTRTSLSDVEFTLLANNCEEFRRKRGYVTQPLSKEEAAYPIAYTISMYKNVEQAERLLRSIYMPQNYYCIHVDMNTAVQVHMAMHSIARCFPNVFIASRLEKVTWCQISIVYAEMNCMGDLLRYK